MMRPEFDRYQIEILSPVHIGNDTQSTPIEFHHDDDFVYTYRLEDIANLIEDPKRLLETKHGRITLKSVIGETALSNLEPLKKIHYWGDENDISHQELELLVEESGENFLPGSSLKGSILHAFEFRHFQKLLNGDKKTFFDLVNNFQKSFAVPDLYFEHIETAIQRGVRITTSTKQSSKNKQRQDNYKEWLMEGKTHHFDAYFRRKRTPDLLDAIHVFTERFLTYQKSYYEYIMDKMDLRNHPLDFEEVQEVLKQIERFRAKNKPDEPVLILGRNAHRYSKSNELHFNQRYKKESGKNLKHPVSRLLVYDAKDSLSIPGMVHIKRR